MVGIVCGVKWKKFSDALESVKSCPHISLKQQENRLLLAFDERFAGLYDTKADLKNNAYDG